MSNLSPSDATGPTTKRRPFFTWKLLGRCLIALAALATLTALFYAEENWHGRRDWERYKQEAEARGLNFDWNKLIPPTVPDDQNFAMTPFLKPLLDLNPRPFVDSPWRDTNGHQRAINFGTNLLNAYDASSTLYSVFPFVPTDLTNVAWKLKHPKPTKNPPANPGSERPMNRAEAAQFILDGMKQYAPVLDEIRAASKLPYARFNVHYDDKDPAGILLPHLAVLRRLSIMFQLEASCDLAVGKTDAAAENVKVIFSLGNSVREEPVIISYLVRNAIFGLAEKVIWEGLSAHQWTDAQLRAFENDLRGLNLVRDGRDKLKCEFGGFHARWFDLIRDDRRYFWELEADMRQADSAVAILYVAPKGWLYQEQIAQQKLFEQRFLPIFDQDATREFPEFVEQQVLDMQKYLPPQAYQWPGFDNPPAPIPEAAYHAPGPMWRLFHHQVTAMFLMPAMQNFFKKPALAQTGVDQTRIACALERYRIANGKYPESLDALTPKFLDKVPFDVCIGEPMKYDRTDDGKFLLYSVGWNVKDDGGKVVVQKDKHQTVDPAQGDWAWPEYE